MNNAWWYRLQLLSARFSSQRIWRFIEYYHQRVSKYLFGVVVFGRSDLNIFPDARLGGLECMCIGNRFTAGRGLWLEAVTNYPAAKQVFSPKLVIGDRVSVGEYVHIGCNHSVVIGNDVLMGSKIYITDHNHGVYSGENPDSPECPPANRNLTEGESVEIGDKCWIGEFVTILPGVKIGEGSIIGSHSTVTHDIPAETIAVGSPARVVKMWDREKRQWVKVTM
ncbi:acyltransferase [Selenomonas caprae]|uniref:Acyltransferase n=1 Tax=Selenomonas caprae TaxID=2606905 RepID=A0A5D6WNY9_9FIRM|nr:acyltransferase [Selenomonas caprae]TYZ29836.1 acyltransferase [Selenomonas caprae]